MKINEPFKRYFQVVNGDEISWAEKVINKHVCNELRRTGYCKGMTISLPSTRRIIARCNRRNNARTKERSRPINKVANKLCSHTQLNGNSAQWKKLRTTGPNGKHLSWRWWNHSNCFYFPSVWSSQIFPLRFRYFWFVLLLICYSIYTIIFICSLRCLCKQ